MSYDEEQHRRSRVVIETPTERREVVQHQTVRAPERERSGFSGWMVAAVAMTAIAATAIVFLFITNSRDDDSTSVSVNARGAAQPTPFVQQQPVMVQSTPPTVVTVPAPATAPSPITVVVQAPPATGTAPTTTTAPPASAPPVTGAADDTAVQSRIDRAIKDDQSLLEAGVTATVLGGKATLNGVVNSDSLKARAERLVYSVKGVQSVDNKITVVPGTP